jgi:acetylcholinesterase
VNVTAQEYALSKFMQGAWANFAKNPTGGPGWNALGTFPADGDLGDLGPAGSSGVTIIPQYPLDARCGLFAPVYAALANNTGDFELQASNTVDSKYIRCGISARLL